MRKKDDEYIRRQDAVDLINKISNLDLKAKGGICISLANLEKADVVQVVHGHWEYIDDTYCGFKDTDVRCSVCKTTTNIKRFRKTKWCPDCGAKMDDRKEHYI